jgi:Tropinone reductase 1
LSRHAIVNDLATFGATVHTCSRTESELNKCLKEWQSQGFSVTGSVCDVSSRPQRENLVQHVSSTFNGKLNIFVSTTQVWIVDCSIYIDLCTIFYGYGTGYEYNTRYDILKKLRCLIVILILPFIPFCIIGYPIPKFVSFGPIV